MDTSNLIQTREMVVKNIYSTIRLIEKNEEVDKNSIFFKFINTCPFLMSCSLLKMLGYNYLFETDGLIYYSKNLNVKLGPLLLELKIDDEDYKEIFDYYDNNVPIKLILSDSNIKINENSKITIKFLKIGDQNEKIINYSDINFISKIELFS